MLERCKIKFASSIPPLFVGAGTRSNHNSDIQPLSWHARPSPYKAHTMSKKQSSLLPCCRKLHNLISSLHFVIYAYTYYYPNPNIVEVQHIYSYLAMPNGYLVLPEQSLYMCWMGVNYLGYLHDACLQNLYLTNQERKKKSLGGGGLWVLKINKKRSPKVKH